MKIPLKIIDSSNQEKLTNDTNEFISLLSSKEREVLRKHFLTGVINEEELGIIKNSKLDIEGFMSSSENLSSLEKDLILNAINDIVSETRSKVNDILNFKEDPSIIDGTVSRPALELK